jgi:hypothetical protein
MFRTRSPSFGRIFLSLLFLAPSAVYSLPGSSHALVLESSMDSFRQGSLQQTVISNSVLDATGNNIALPT